MPEQHLHLQGSQYSVARDVRVRIVSRGIPMNLVCDALAAQLMAWFFAKNCEVYSPFLPTQVGLDPRCRQLASIFLSRRPQFRKEATAGITVEDDLTVRTRTMA